MNCWINIYIYICFVKWINSCETSKTSRFFKILISFRNFQTLSLSAKPSEVFLGFWYFFRFFIKFLYLLSNSPFQIIIFIINFIEKANHVRREQWRNRMLVGFLLHTRYVKFYFFIFFFAGEHVEFQPYRFDNTVYLRNVSTCM